MSGGNKGIELQMQMRQNTEDLHDFMKELDSWQEDIKKKDELLREGSQADSQKALPAVRNKDYKKKRKVRSKGSAKNSQEEQKPEQRIKSYDYKSWDKFDVEKALETMDKEGSPAESNESDSEEVQVDRDLATAEKEKGNQFFRDGKYDDAIECYTRGMSADPYNPVLPTNRATCFFRLKKFMLDVLFHYITYRCHQKDLVRLKADICRYAVAESDCNLAIALDSKYTKAYSRRGAACVALKSYHCALQDYEMVIKLDPENLDAQNEIKKLKQILASQEKVESTVTEAPPTNPAKPTQMDEEQQRRQEAAIQKDRGNAYFKEGRYEAAVECYTRGMEADATNALLAANRAMAYLKLERFTEAEQDCTKAIALDSTYSKAFARRAAARAALSKLSEAKEDFEKVLTLDPGNKQAINELKKLNLEMSPTGLQQADDSHRRTVQPVTKPEHLRSTKPMKRIEIEEVDGNITPLAEPQRLMANTSSPTAVPSSIDPSHSSSAKIQKIEVLSDCPSQSLDSGSAGDFSGKQNKEENKAASMEQSSAFSSSSVQSEVIPSAPTNSFQLEADLRKLSQSPELCYKYLKQIPPDTYQTTFQNSLEPDVLNKILKVLHSFYIMNEEPSAILAILKSLSVVRRFDMAVMFMSRTEKQVLQELFECIGSAGLHDDAVQALKKKYGV